MYKDVDVGKDFDLGVGNVWGEGLGIDGGVNGWIREVMTRLWKMSSPQIERFLYPWKMTKDKERG